MKTETEIPEGCLAFNLEKARAGHPCQTRDGVPTRYIGEMPMAPHCKVLWLASTGHPLQTTEEGSYLPSECEDDNDVFLAVPTTQGFTPPNPKVYLGGTVE